MSPEVPSKIGIRGVCDNPHSVAGQRLITLGQAAVPVPHLKERLVRLPPMRVQYLLAGRCVEYLVPDSRHEFFRRHGGNIPASAGRGAHVMIALPSVLHLP